MRTLKLSALGLLTLALCAGLPLAGPADEHAHGGGESPDAVLQRLKEGNDRFTKETSLHPHVSLDWRERLTLEQHPSAVILGCSDSRVPVEMVFDQGFGDLFVIRVAGNIVDDNVDGSIEYGILHAGAPLVVVMGHERCGAVTAALGDYTHEPLTVQGLLKNIVPALQGIPPGPLDQRVQKGVYANVRQAVRELRCISSIQHLLKQGKVKIVGGVYHLQSGRVEFLEEKP